MPTRFGKLRGEGKALENAVAGTHGTDRRPPLTLRAAALPHHARDEPGLAPRGLDFLFQKAMRVSSDISRSRIGPGPAFIVADASRLAGIVAVAAFQFEIAVVAAEPVDRNFLGPAARFDDAGAAHARDAAIVLSARRHVAL